MTWEDQKAREAEALRKSRRAWFEKIDGVQITHAARRAGMDPTSLSRMVRQVDYEWRKRPTPARKRSTTLQPTINNLRSGMTPAQREAMDRAVRAGMKPVYAAAEAMRVMA